MDEACKIFLHVCHQRFTVVYVWRLLEDELKWKEQEMSNSSKRSKASFTGIYSSTSNPKKSHI
jgi:hypothetical protein